MTVRIIKGDVRDVLPTLAADSFDCIVTSPPYYGLRDYGTATWEGGDPNCKHLDQSYGKGRGSGVWFDGGKPRELEGGRPLKGQCPCGAQRIDAQIGLEPTLDAYLETMVAVCRELRRVLKPSGVFFLNIGDSYASTTKGSGGTGKSGLNCGIVLGDKSNAAAKFNVRNFDIAGDGLKPKDLCLVPERLGIALQADGWWVRSHIIWHKPNPMPESCTDRPTSSHETIWMLTKAARYFWDAEAVKEEALQPIGEPKQTGNRKRKLLHENDPVHCHFESSSTSILGSNQGAPSRNIRNVWSVASHPFTGWFDSIDLVLLPASEALELAASGNACARDTARITSPNCPMHGGLPDLLPTGFCDGLSVDHLSRIRGNGGHRGEGIPDDCDPILHTATHSQAPLSKTDYSGREDFSTATLHSTETRKMDRAPVSFSHASSYEEIPDGTLHTEPSPSERVSTCHDIGVNKSAVYNSASNCAQQIESRNDRTPELDNSVSCCCKYYRKVSKKSSHFATFPPALVERCIKAGSPAGGHVLDPFSGAGTTGLVADRLGRDCTLIDLNTEYAQMAADRIRDDAPLFTEVSAE